MCWNRTNYNNNVMGDSGRRRCGCGNVAGDRGRRCGCGNVAGDSGRRCICECECRFVNGRVESTIALRGPGCIAGTGRCGRDTANFVEQDFGGCCGQVSPCGNVQSNGGRRPCDCRCFNRCLRELLEDITDDGCPR